MKKSRSSATKKAKVTAPPKLLKQKIVTEKRTSEREKAKRAAGMRNGKGPARIAHIPAHEQKATTREKFVPGLLVVQVKPDVVDTVPDIRRATMDVVRNLSLPEAVDAPFRDLDAKGLIREIRPVFSRMTAGRSLSMAPTNAAVSFAISVRDSENEDLLGVNMIRLNRSVDLQKVKKELESTPGIEYVHQVPRRWMTARRRPDDPLMRRQWGLTSIGWFKVEPFPNATTVKVAVLDSGVDLNHRDLKNTIRSYNYEGSSSVDIIGHGTHLAGIIGAQTNNNVGISGVCQCDLNVWKIFSDTPDPDDGEFYVDDVMYKRALNAVRTSGMRVLNLSIAGEGRDRTEERLLRRLVAAGVTVVAAMGNEFKEGNPISFPGAYRDVIAVGAVGKTKRRASFSNTGSHVSIAAPGLGIVSTLPLKASAARSSAETRYASWDGTSQATSLVAGAAALVLARNPDLTPAQVRERLISTATKLSAMGNKSKTNEYGFGLLNIEQALS
jgi:subtilisin family serine protease